MKYVLLTGRRNRCSAQFIETMTEREMVEAWLEGGDYPSLEDMAGDSTGLTMEQWAEEVADRMALKWWDGLGNPVDVRATVLNVLTAIVDA